jgi:redox-sensitive bicupin YhaK (pirin superfamily)
MRSIRRSDERGSGEHGWLSSRHTFSFANYYDERFMGFRDLRVINEDRVAPGRGFPPHGHRDMEILSYVIAGALEHEDSMGNGSVIVPGEVQRMSAGTGVRHSEYNHSQTEPVHFLQIWIQPSERGLRPGYEQKTFRDDDKRNAFALIASQDGRQGSLTINQNANVYAALIEPHATLSFTPQPGRHVWLHVATGAIEVDGDELSAGDALATDASNAVSIAGVDAAQVLLFELS